MSDEPARTEKSPSVAQAVPPVNIPASAFPGLAILCAMTVLTHLLLLNFWPQPVVTREAMNLGANGSALAFSDSRTVPRRNTTTGGSLLARNELLPDQTPEVADQRDSEPAPFQPHEPPVPLHQAEGIPLMELPLQNPAILPDLPLDGADSDPPRITDQQTSGDKTARSPERSPEISSREESARRQRREVIKKELPSASNEELEIWVDQFDGVPLESLRDLIRLRQQFPVGLPKTSVGIGSENVEQQEIDIPERALPQMEIPSGSEETFAGEVDRSQIPAPSGGEMLRTADVIEAVAPEIRVLRAAQNIHRQNMAQAKTTGYRRRVVQLQSSGTQEADQGATLKTTIDPSPGEWIITERPMDLAIQGYGWFVVRHDQQQLLTRVGHLVWNENRQLAVEIGTKSYPLDPPIVAPEGCTQLLIEETGHIQAAAAGSELAALGVITMATVPDATQLQEKIPGLFATTGKSGNAVLHTAQTARSGKLIAGRLEQSNVNPEVELQFHRDLDDQISLLRTAWEESLSRLNWARNE